MSMSQKTGRNMYNAALTYQCCHAFCSERKNIFCEYNSGL